jgi:hypothetical protein
MRCALTIHSSRSRFAARLNSGVRPLMLRRRLCNTLAMAFSLVGLAACEAKYYDVSGNQKHRDLIGRRCELLISLRAHGVGDKYGPVKRTDYVSVWNPGFTGPEVTFTKYLTAGTKFRVVAAKQCANCPFERRLHYRIAVTPEPEEFSGIPVLVRAESFTPREVSCESSRDAA